jgi:hypothetical protein
MIDGDPKEIISYVKQLQSNGIHNIRLLFTKNNEDNLNIIRSYFRANGSVEIEADFKNKQVMEDIKQLDDKYKEYQYIFEDFRAEYILSKYINQCKGYTYITGENLVNFLEKI